MRYTSGGYRCSTSGSPMTGRSLRPSGRNGDTGWAFLPGVARGCSGLAPRPLVLTARHDRHVSSPSQQLWRRLPSLCLFLPSIGTTLLMLSRPTGTPDQQASQLVPTSAWCRGSTGQFFWALHTGGASCQSAGPELGADRQRCCTNTYVERTCPNHNHHHHHRARRSKCRNSSVLTLFLFRVSGG